MKFKGTIVTGDFDENTVTIQMDEPITLKAGEYFVIPKEKYKAPKMLEMIKKIVEQYDYFAIRDEDIKQLKNLIKEVEVTVI